MITQEDIQRSGAVSLTEALRLAPSLQVARIDARQWAVSARGFNSTSANKLLVLIDGRAVYTPLFAGVFWDAQNTNLADVERIEVISGPGATQWGANAVNGVINVITKRAQDTQGLVVHAAAGDELRGAADLRYGGARGNWYYRGYARYLREDDVVLPSGAAVPTAWHHGQAGFRVDGELSKSDALTVLGDTYRGTAEQPARGRAQRRESRGALDPHDGAGRRAAAPGCTSITGTEVSPACSRRTSRPTTSIFSIACTSERATT